MRFLKLSHLKSKKEDKFEECDTLILHACFGQLVSFVEDQHDSFQEDLNWRLNDPEAKDCSCEEQKHTECWAAAYTVFNDLYIWWKEYVDKYNANPFLKAQSLNKSVFELEAEEQKNLELLIKYRGYMWT